MRKFSFLILVFVTSSLLAETFSGKEISYQTKGPEDLSDLRLEIPYKVECKASTKDLPAITGHLKYDNRIVRFELFKYNDSVQIGLGVGKGDISATIILEESANCSLVLDSQKLKLHSQLEKKMDTLDLKAAVQRYSPFLVVRPNQRKNRLTDLPLAMAYSVKRTDKELEISYVVYFSDEDSRPKTFDTKVSMGRFGRCSDIEILYAVKIDPTTGEKLPNGERYQGPQFATFGHNPNTPFKGKYLPDSQHPILYDITDNNVFADNTKAPQTNEIGYHLVPQFEAHEIKSGEARELVAKRAFPWTYEVTDIELRRENKFFEAFNEQLYVEVKGSGKFFRVDIELNGKSYLAGVGTNQTEKVGAHNDFEDDVWNASRITAIPVPLSVLNVLLNEKPTGSLIITKQNAGLDFTVDLVRFYKAVKAQDGKISFTEVTERFGCQIKPGTKIPKDQASAELCKFNPR